MAILESLRALIPGRKYLSGSKLGRTAFLAPDLKKLVDLRSTVILQNVAPDQLSYIQRSLIGQLCARPSFREASLFFLVEEQTYLFVPNKLLAHDPSRPQIRVKNSGLAIFDSACAGQLLQEIAEQKRLAKPPRPLAEITEQAKTVLRGQTEQAETFILPHGNDLLVWGKVEIGTPLPAGSKYRGYLQVEHQQIPLAVNLLLSLGRQSLSFKFLITEVEMASVHGRELKMLANDEAGRYVDPDPAKPVLAIYSDKKSEILEILQALSEKPEWPAIEAARAKKGHFSRRAGSSAFKDAAGREWRTLCYGKYAGTAEEGVLAEAHEKGIDWRQLVTGQLTSVMAAL